MSGFAARHKACRERCKLSQMDVAKLIGKHLTTISSWEINDRAPNDVAVLSRLARLYGVRFEWLAIGEGPELSEVTRTEDSMPPSAA